jgi:hypothetical protein
MACRQVYVAVTSHDPSLRTKDGHPAEGADHRAVLDAGPAWEEGRSQLFGIEMSSGIAATDGDERLGARASVSALFLSSSYDAIFHWPPDVRHQSKLYSCGTGRPEKEIAYFRA